MTRAGYILGAIWSLPITAVGLILALVYRAGSFELRSGVLTWECDRVIGNTNAQTWGLVQFYARRDRNHTLRDEARLRRHENTHTLHPWGLLYALEFTARLPFYPARDGVPRWKRAYRAATWERMARNREQNPDAWGSE